MGDISETYKSFVSSIRSSLNPGRIQEALRLYRVYTADELKELGKVNLEKLKSLRESVDWEIEKERLEFFSELHSLISNWKGDVPMNLLNIFRKEEIEWILTKDVEKFHNHLYLHVIVNFVIKTGYKDQPDVGNDGKPSSRRNTPVHAARKGRCSHLIPDLFKIYDRFDVNYTDEFGFTHLHAACMARDCLDVVKKFIEHGHDPNCLVTKTGDSPLHISLTNYNHKVTEFLLKNGADPNLANGDGLTPLHLICQKYDDYLETFFKITDDLNQVVQIDAVDKCGRTPLQWAVANFMLQNIDVLIDRGADLSIFVFPDDSYFAVGLEPIDDEDEDTFKITLASGALAVVESLENRGYTLNRSDAMTIIKLIAKFGIFEKSVNLEKYRYYDEKFTAESKELITSSSRSLYKFTQLRCKLEKLITKAEHSDLWCINYDLLSEGLGEHLCEKTFKRFFRRWALDSLFELTSYQLPILCCEKVIEPLVNSDLCNICLAATVNNL